MIPLTLALLLTGSAHAAPAPAPACPAATPLDRDGLSVAWVTPASRHVWPWTRITVIPTRELRDRARATKASTARFLQLVGERRSPRAPRRPWIVVVFDVEAHALCRPVDLDRVTTERYGAVPVCPSGDRGVGLRDDGCGATIDLGTDKVGLPIHRVRWRDAAARGFCALPVERFLRGQ